MKRDALFDYQPQRLPAYTDRVLWRSLPGIPFATPHPHLLLWACHPPIISPSASQESLRMTERSSHRCEQCRSCGIGCDMMSLFYDNINATFFLFALSLSLSLSLFLSLCVCVWCVFVGGVYLTLNNPISRP